MPKMATFKIDNYNVKKRLSIKLEHHQKVFLCLFSRKKKKEKISYFIFHFSFFIFFDKNHGLTLYKKPEMANFKNGYVYSKKAFVLN